MTDRVRQLIVTLDRTERVDDIEHIAGAIALIKGVAGVDVVVDKFDDELARMAVRAEFREKLHRAVEVILSDKVK